ncbi:hypothetical protein ACIRO3_16380 [Streptomyces sp. NPDC102278]|uniref:hypothetical protein n=1 Tax=Streptomyces sp. NPDC102278 TaxID=3366152 RepID=UPI0038191819
MKSSILSGLRKNGHRAGLVSLGAVTLLSLMAGPVHAASWSSYLSGAYPDYESRRWSDAGGSTNIQFTNCEDGTGATSAGVTLRKDVDWQVDPAYSTASFTNCFNGYSSTSSGNWGDHGSGNYYFAVNQGATYSDLDVRVVSVNY